MALQMKEASLDAPGGQASGISPTISVEEQNDVIFEEDAQNHEQAFSAASKSINNGEDASIDASGEMDQLHPASVTDDEWDEDFDECSTRATLEPRQSNETSGSSVPKIPSLVSMNVPP